MRPSTTAAIALLLTALATETFAGQGYHILSTQRTTHGHFVRDATTVQQGNNPINHFTYYRVRHAHHPFAVGVIVLLPGAFNTFGMYEFSDTGDYADSFAGYFLRHGFEVWGYTPREATISAGECETTLDCSPARDWGIATRVEDVEFIRKQIHKKHPLRKPYIAGFSLGSMTAIASVNAHPRAYAGMIAWDGSMLTNDPAIAQYNAPLCQAVTAQLAGGAIMDTSGAFIQTLAGLAASAPNDPSPLGIFPPGVTNLQGFLLVVSLHEDMPFQPTPAYVTAAGDPFAQTLTYSNLGRLTSALTQTFVDVMPIRIFADANCSLAGTLDEFGDDLHRFKAPSLLLRAGLGFGTAMTDLPAMLSASDVTDVLYEGYGHMDTIAAPDHTDLVEDVILQWFYSDAWWHQFLP